MSRLIIGRDGTIVTSNEPDDWLQTKAREQPGRCRPAVATTIEALPSGTSAASDRRTRTSPPDTALGRRRATILAVALTGAATALLLVVALGHGPSRPSTSDRATVSAPGTAATRLSTTKDQAVRGSGSSAVELPKRGRLWTGDTSARVKRLQTALAAAGISPGKPDGIYGPRTRAAVIAFQKAHHLRPDGIVGPRTAATLNATLAEHGK